MVTLRSDWAETEVGLMPEFLLQRLAVPPLVEKPAAKGNKRLVEANRRGAAPTPHEHDEDGIMRLLVITSCTGEKALHRPDQLTLRDFQDEQCLPRRERDLAAWCKPAWEMYTGQQHVRLMDGVRLLRQRFGAEAVELHIVSAGYGLVAEDRLIAPYEATFNSMTAGQARAWARKLGVAERVRDAIRGFPLVVFLLGARYQEAIEPPVLPEPDQRLVFFAGLGKIKRLAARGVIVVPAGKPEATAYGEGLVALKGKMLLLLARELVRQGERLYDAIRWDDTPATVEEALRSARQRDVAAG
jgi:hypothetical protein